MRRVFSGLGAVSKASAGLLLALAVLATPALAQSPLGGSTSAAPAAPAVADIAGVWRGNNEVIVRIEQEGSSLTWRAPENGYEGTGSVVGDRVTLTSIKPRQHSVSGTVSGDSIAFDDGTSLDRVR